MARKTSDDRAKQTAVEKGLRGLFDRLRGRPVPEHLISVVDQLDAEPPVKKSRRG